MELKQNPFSFYDFLGYFIPGSVFLYACMIANNVLNSASSSIESLSQMTGMGRAELYLPFILFAYIVGHFLNFLSSITIERYSLWAMGYPSKYLLGVKGSGYFSLKENKIIRGIIRILVFIVILPVSLMDLVLGRWFGLRDIYSKPLDPLLQQLIRQKIYSLISSHGGVSNLESHSGPRDNDFFHYAYHYAVENAPSHLPKMQNYVALYGFLRTITFLSVIFFWLFVWYGINNKHCEPSFYILTFGIAFVCYLNFMAFVKFYRRFSFEALMAASVVHQKT